VVIDSLKTFHWTNDIAVSTMASMENTDMREIMAAERSGSGRRRIAIDMDGVLVDTYPAQLAFVADEYGLSPDPDQRLRQALTDWLPDEAMAGLRRHMRRAHFFAGLSPMRGAIDVLHRLVGRYDVFIATAAMEYPNSLAPKFDWLRRHVPFIDPLQYIFCGHKYMLDVDWLIDDHARHFTALRGTPMLFTAPHNRQLTGYLRVDDWQDVARHLEGAAAAGGTAP
jgi:5'-nucleotidase